MWSLAAPLALLLLPAPLLVRWLAPPVRSVGAVLYIPQGLADSARPEAASAAGRWLQAVLLGLVWVSLVLALAGPQRTEPSGIIPASGRDILLALDLSGSMEKEDFSLGGAPISRLDAVKRVAARFVSDRRGDRVGLVVFGERPYVAAPLTFDVDAVAEVIEAAQLGISGRSTALADGLGLAMKRLLDSGGDTRVVILLSDGIDTAGVIDAREAARLAAEQGLRIHTIALGPADLASAPDDRDAVDAATLEAIAEESGGASFRVRTLEDLGAVAEALDALEPNPRASPPLLVTRPYWPWPAGLALLLCLGLGFARRAP